MQIRDRHLAGLGAAACAVCCAAPVLGLLGIAGAGLLGTLAALAFAGLSFAVVVSVASLIGLLLRGSNQHRGEPCHELGPVDLGMPEPQRSGPAE